MLVWLPASAPVVLLYRIGIEIDIVETADIDRRHGVALRDWATIKDHMRLTVRRAPEVVINVKVAAAPAMMIKGRFATYCAT